MLFIRLVTIPSMTRQALLPRLGRSDTSLRPSRVIVYTLQTYCLASFNIPFALALHSGFFCFLVLSVSTADISVSGPHPPTGTCSFIKSEEFCFLSLLHRFLGFLGSGLLAPLAVGWYFEEYGLW